MEPIIIIDSDYEQGQEVCEILHQCKYRTTIFVSVENLKESIEEEECRVMFFNLDTVPIDNRVIKDLKKKNSSTFIIVSSSKSFHPELEDALRDHIYACLKQPIDPDELIYWIKAIEDNDKTQVI